MPNVFLNALSNRDNPKTAESPKTTKQEATTPSKISPSPIKGGNVFVESLQARDNEQNKNILSSIGQAALKTGAANTRNPLESVLPTRPLIVPSQPGPTIEAAKNLPPPTITPPPSEQIPTEATPPSPQPPTTTPPVSTMLLRKNNEPPVATLSEGKAPLFEGVHFTENGIEAPSLNLNGKGGWVGKAAEKVVNIPAQGLTNFANRLGDTFDMIAGMPKRIKGTLEYKPIEATGTEKVASATNTALAGINLIPSWLLTSTALEAAKEAPINLKTIGGAGKYIAPLNPILGATVDIGSIMPGAEKVDLNPANKISKGFELLGKVGSFISGKALDVAPISEESKAVLRQPVEEIGALLSQVGLAHYGMKYGGDIIGKSREQITKFNDTMGEKVKTLQKEGTEITPEVAKQIIAETAKEQPLPPQPAVMKIPVEGEAPVNLHTDQKLALENFVKNADDITYHKVKTLGKDTAGNPIQARFEWDYKRGEGHVYTTSRTTAKNLAHELGHYFDQKLSGEINTKLTEILPDYTKNKELVDASLNSFAVEKSGDKATPKMVDQTVKELTDNFKPEVSKVSKRGTLNEQFADAVAMVITDPVKAQKVMPTVAPFIEFSLRDKGIIAERVKEVAKEVAPEQAPAIIPREEVPLEAPQPTLKSEPITPELPNQKPITEEIKTETPPPSTITSSEAPSIPPEQAQVVEAYKELQNKNPEPANRWVAETMARENIGPAEAMGRLQEIGRQYSETSHPTTENALNAPSNAPRTETTQISTPEVKNAPVPTEVVKTTTPEVVKGTKDAVIAGTGLKTGKTVETKSYNPDKINGPADVEKIIEGVSEMSKKDINKQRISKSDENLRALANEVGLTVDQLLEAKPGSIANAETMIKSRQILADMASDVREMVREMSTENASPERLQMLREKVMRLQGVMKTVAGFRTEASNVFRSFKMEVRPGENDIMLDLMKQLQKVDGESAGNLSEFMRKTKEVMEPTKMDKIWHAWYASILSGPVTHLRNFLGNLSSVVSEVGATAIRNPKEVPTALTGLFQGLIKGGKEFGDILKTQDVGKYAERGIKPIEFKGILRPLNALDYVGRMMSATDNLFAEGFKGMERRALARETAIKEGLKGDKLQERIKELNERPTPEMEQQVEQYGKYGTFNQEPQGALGALATGLGSVARKVPGGKLIMPFSRVVANVLNNSLDWTPVGIKRGLLREVKIGDKSYLKEGGIFSEFSKEARTDRQRYQQISRGTLGTIGMIYFSTLAAQGLLSGNGPSSYSKKQQLMATGWRPNAIKIGDKWIPYKNFGPLAMPMAIVGNYFDAGKYEGMDEKDLTSRLSAGMLGTANTVLDNSFISGLSDLMGAIKDWDKGGASYVKNFISQNATAPVPNFFKQIPGLFDRDVYDTHNIKEQIMANLHITNGLKQRINVWGEPIKRDLISGMSPSNESNDQVKKYLIDNDIYLSVPSKTTKIKVNGESRVMTQDEYYEYMKQSGQEIKRQLDAKFEQLQKISPERKEKFVDNIVQEVRDKIKTRIAKQAK